MSKSESIRLDDVRAVFRLVGECRELGHDPVRWQTHLANGLIALLHSELVMAGEYRIVAGRPVPVCAVDVGWSTARARRLFLEWQCSPDLPDNPMIAPFYAAPGPRATWGEDSCPDAAFTAAEWRRSPYFNELMIPSDLQESMITRREAADGSTHVVVLGRRRHVRPFGERDRLLLQLVHDELAPHLGKTLANSTDPVGRLSPRLRETLACLLDGDPEKRIAARLGIASSTLHDHVKRVYRHFGVGSRPELMAYFLRRGWQAPG